MMKVSTEQGKYSKHNVRNPKRAKSLCYRDKELTKMMIPTILILSNLLTKITGDMEILSIDHLMSPLNLGKTHVIYSKHTFIHAASLNLIRNSIEELEFELTK